MKLISPNGKITVIAHPTQVEYYLSKGWKEEAPISKSSSKKSDNLSIANGFCSLSSNVSNIL